MSMGKCCCPCRCPALLNLPSRFEQPPSESQRRAIVNILKGHNVVIQSPSRTDQATMFAIPFLQSMRLDCPAIYRSIFDS
jgi:hypothetical protein